MPIDKNQGNAFLPKLESINSPITIDKNDINVIVIGNLSQTKVVSFGLLWYQAEPKPVKKMPIKKNKKLFFKA